MLRVTSNTKRALCRELRAVYEAAHSEQMAAYRSLQQERADARHQKHMAFACNTAWQMVAFAEQAIKYREESDGAKVPKALYRWKHSCSEQLKGCMIPVTQTPQQIRPWLTCSQAGSGTTIRACQICMCTARTRCV